MKDVRLITTLFAGLILGLATTDANKTFGMKEQLGDIVDPNDEKVSFMDYLYGLNRGQREEIILDHRKYRSQVKPTASDMKFIEWDRSLAELAYNWSLTCNEHHGMTNSMRGQVGQNMFWGPNKLLAKGTNYWHSEHVDYDYRTNRCAEGRMCGHYTGIVWADVQVMGCGANVCNDDKTMLVCNYFPAFNIVAQKPYVEGPPCTKCDKGTGCRCYQNMCMTKRQCLKHGLKCKCNMVCLNCGELDEEECACKCKSGWDEGDCSEICQNVLYKLCGKSPGWFLPEHCESDPEVKFRRCRQFCGQCKALDLSNPSDICCDGAVCSENQALNSKCICVSTAEALKEAYEIKHAKESRAMADSKNVLPRAGPGSHTFPAGRLAPWSPYSNHKKSSTSSGYDIPSLPNGASNLKAAITIVLCTVFCKTIKICNLKFK